MKKNNAKPKRIAIVTELSWPLRRHYELIAGVQEYAHKHDHWTIVVSRFPHVQMEQGVHFDGIIGRIRPSLYDALKKHKIPLVNVLTSSEIADKAPSVLIDLHTAGRMAAEHLIKRGMTQIVGVQTYTDEPYIAGASEATREHGLQFHRLRLPVYQDDTEANWRRTNKKLRALTDKLTPPIGVTASGDYVARVMMTQMQDLGWHIPRDMSVVGTYNEETICTTTHPTLSSIDMGCLRNGYEAAKLLDGLMRGQKAPKQPISTKPKGIVVRASSDAFSARDPEVQAALRFLADNSHHPIRVPDVTSATGVGRKTLERRFKEELGTTIYNELHRLRIERVKRQLVENVEAPIKEIGSNAGFASLSNFYAAFKKQTGVTPEAYRAEHADPTRW